MDIAVGQHSIHVRENGSGYPVLFGHSLTFDGDMWEEQATALGDGYRCLRLDFRGHGRSSKVDEPYTLWDNARDVIAVADTLDLGTFHYVGLSMGGMTGMRLALEHPERIRRLALLDTDAAAEEPSARRAYRRFAESSRAMPTQPAVTEMLLGLMFSDPFRQRDPETTDRYRQKIVDNDRIAMSQATLAVVDRESILERLGEIGHPTLVVVGSLDRPTPVDKAEQIAAGIPNARLVVVEDAGHMTPVETPEAITRLLSDFLEGT
jgi:pimeloyl-ACP methyl ester carboxylesterase